MGWAIMSDARWASTSDPYVTPGSGDAWAEQAASQGATGSQRLIAVETVPAPPDVRDALALKDGEDVVVRRRLILLDDQPIELADSFYPATLATGTDLAEPRKIPGGAVAVLDQLGCVPAGVTEQVSARQPTADERAILEIEGDDWLLVLTRVSRDISGRPVEYASMRTIARLTSGHTYQLQVGQP
jgi:GntR family transcriptional regulator